MSTNALRDISWYLKNHKLFSFSGTKEFLTKEGQQRIVTSPSGLSAVECFYIYDTTGKVVPTRQFLKLLKLYTTKASVNLHIKMYAEDRASGILPKIEFNRFCAKIKAPPWFKEAVETQKYKYYTDPF